ncbi:MAG TPA: hypothetical protein VI032_06400 [Burkholderiaceae bacterium]
MSTRSTLPTLAAIVLLAWGPCVGAEAFDPHATAIGPTVHQSRPLSSLLALRGEAASLRSSGHDAIAPWQPLSGGWRAGLAAWWPDSAASGATQARRRLSFDPRPDDERAGSSASITLGRLNLNESRNAAAPGGAWQADVDRELAQLRESIGRMRQVPQVSLGMRVKF